MKFKYIGPKVYNEFDEEVTVNNYGGAQIKNGDVFELKGRYADKAGSNPNYELVKTGTKKSAPVGLAVDSLEKNDD